MRTRFTRIIHLFFIKNVVDLDNIPYDLIQNSNRVKMGDNAST